MTMKNNNIVTKFLLLSLLLFAAPAAKAQFQEYIREVQGLQTEYSIVREYSQDTMLVYSQNYKDGTGGRFMKVAESGAVVISMVILDEMYISDFEIYNDTVYFCGDYSFNGLQRGIMGFFDLSTFPNPTIRAHRSQAFYSFEKLDVVNSIYGGPLHIVMTGKHRENGDCLIDAPKPSGGPWPFFYIRGAFEDVAMTNRHVVATYRKDRVGALYHFGHPTLGGLIFWGIINRIDLDSNITSPMLLEYDHPDYYSASYRKTVGSNTEIIINRFDEQHSNYNRIVIPVSNATQCPKEIKYNSYDDVLDVLCNETSGTVTNSIIYHLQGYYLSGCHHFDDKKITSIEYMTTDPHYFYSSGQGINGLLWLFKNASLAQRAACSWLDIPVYTDSYERMWYQEAFFDILDELELLSVVAHEEKVDMLLLRCYKDFKEEESEPENE